MHSGKRGPSPSIISVLPVKCNSLIWDILVETGLCIDVDIAVSDFHLFGQPESQFVHLIFLQLGINQ